MLLRRAEGLDPRDRYRALVLEQADAISRREPIETSERPDHLHFRGLLARNTGRHDLALAWLGRAAELEPDNAEYWADFGHALAARDRPVDALHAHRRSLSLAPDDTLYACSVAGALFRAGHRPEAIRSYRGVLRLDRECVRAHAGLGDVLLATGEVAESFACYERALELDPDRTESYLRLGRANLAAGQLEAAVDVLRMGLVLRGDKLQLYVALGDSLLRLHMFGESIAALRAAIELEPHNISACQLLVHALDESGRDDESVGAWCLLAAAFDEAGRFEEAVAAYRQALSRDARCVEALIGLGWACVQCARPRDALGPLEVALSIRPDDMAVRRCLGWAYALVGDLERTWREAAYLDRQVVKRFEQPAWDGSPLTGQRILLWANAGLGDALLFARFAKMVKCLGATVVVECQSVLIPLIRRMQFVDDVVGQAAPLPGFDRHILLGALPQVFQTGWDRIPAPVPYASADRISLVTWRKRLGASASRSIGLRWAGGQYGTNSSLRFMPLSAFGRLASVPDLRLVSLQMGEETVELSTQSDGLRVESVLSESCSILDTAALIMNLDLVITVDTMIAHLAGALGRTVWLLVPFAADWRWQAAGDTTPWYPTMRLFRQAAAGDWDGVIEQVVEVLEETASCLTEG
jgi:tetratricopeptide (TPR) repeat protein